MKRTLFVVAVFVSLGVVFLPQAGNQAFAQASPSPTPTPKPTPNVLEDDTVYKVDTELVNISVRVIDRAGRPVNKLSESDFKIFEDNVQQQIEFFSRSELPTNYAIVVDNSGSLRSQLEKVIEAGKILVSSNGPNDETQLIRFVGKDKISIEQDFTSNKADLNDSLDNLFIEGGQTAITDAVYLAVENVEDYEKSSKAVDRKRRAIILVTDGEDRDSFYSDKQLFDLLRESETQIYVIGFVSELSSEGSIIRKSAQSKAKSYLERMATETGGKAYFPNSVDELAGIAKDIGAELRTQFSIGYVPTNDRKDGTFRSIKVQVADGPNKEKRIPITRAGRTAEAETPAKPATATTTKP
ncbi:MAG: VWA domain-containing protein [Blastocatellia bacterium]|nr:VWA domain-containing protein [Blastocatellia bacterium]